MSEELPDLPDPEPIPEDFPDSGKPTSMIAREVIAGHWGRGRARNQRLSEAGHNVADVNEEIDRIFNRS